MRAITTSRHGTIVPYLKALIPHSDLIDQTNKRGMGVFRDVLPFDIGFFIQDFGH